MSSRTSPHPGRHRARHWPGPAVVILALVRAATAGGLRLAPVPPPASPIASFPADSGASGAPGPVHEPAPGSSDQGSNRDEPDSVLARGLVGLGLEDVSASRVSASARVAYENRHFRHPSTALGNAVRIAREAGTTDTLWAVERRLGLAVAAFPSVAGSGPSRVLYPGDPAFPAPPAGPALGATEHDLDLLLRPLVTYEVGRIFDPVLVRLELEPELRVNPWPGGRARAALVVPLRNDFETDAIHPDINQVRPGPSALDQFAWSPGQLLLSGSAGLFQDNRYGASAGLTRPFEGGRVWLDLQADLTGFIAFTDTGTVYSHPTHWSGFAGLTYWPGALDLSIRARIARFLYDDQGVELQVMRSMGDLDVGLFAQRTGGLNVVGVRLVLPVPPADRPVGSPVRAQLVDRFPVEYRDEAAPVGTFLRGAAAREDFVRQCNPSSLAANRGRYERAVGQPPESHAGDPPQWVSLTGMTGFINTPWCGVMPDRHLEVGFNSISKEAAYDHRGEHRNDEYYATMGFLPHVELGLRWTVIPGLKSFADLVPDSRLTDSDRMISARIEAIPPTARRPGLAVGVEDAVGTRRFHSTYAVTGMRWSGSPLRGRIMLGYAPPVLSAARHTLDGAFGAVEISPWRFVAAALEYDTEKPNAALGIDLGFGFKARVASLDVRHIGGGVGWAHAL